VIIATSGPTYLIGFGLEHESDHETAHAYSHAGFFTQNAMAAQLLTSLRIAAFALTLGPTLRLYLASCTRDRTTCRNFRGDASVGAQLDAVMDAPGWSFASLVPYLSAAGTEIVRHAAVRGERRLVMQLGLSHRTQLLLLQLFGLLYLGNDVGILQAQRVVQLGLGARVTF
jgi:hypothetical protein